MKYGNIIDYVEDELRGFDELPLSAVDSLVLSQFSYNEMSPFFSPPEEAKSLTIGETLRAEHFSPMFDAIFEEEKSRLLLCAMAASPRFRDLKLSHYVSEYDAQEGKQFSAVCIRLSESLTYIVFRGTDDSLIGWKEDFGLAFRPQVPSQRRASEYFTLVAACERGSFILGGHSKGGNLAVYAAMTVSADIQQRIIAVYDHDGPGFKEGVLDNDGYLRIKDRINKTVPQSSLIGMLLDGHDSYSVVCCRRLGGVMQHNPFMWEVSPEGSFRPVDEVTESAKYVNTAMRMWIDGLTDEEFERLVETLFGIFQAGNAETLSEITQQWRKNAKAMFAALKDLDPETKGHLRELVRDFTSLLGQNIRLMLPRLRDPHSKNE